MEKAIDWQTVRYAFSKLPSLGDIYSEHTWERHRQELRNHVMSGDPSIMLRWSTIQATMFVGDGKIANAELQKLMDDNMMPRYRLAMQENEFGSPPRMNKAFYTSGNLVHQVAHLDIFERVTGLRVEDAGTILEFGGGYGAMCAICRRLGFVGDYFIADFPELVLLQAYYLSALGYPSYHLEMDGEVPEVLPKQTDILFAIYSLSEAPIKLRDDFFDAAAPQSCIIAYQTHYNHIDNEVYFTGLVGRHTEYDWQSIDNPYTEPGHKYLIGVKR